MSEELLLLNSIMLGIGAGTALVGTIAFCPWFFDNRKYGECSWWPTVVCLVFTVIFVIAIIYLPMFEFSG